MESWDEVWDVEGSEGWKSGAVGMGGLGRWGSDGEVAWMGLCRGNGQVFFNLGMVDSGVFDWLISGFFGWGYGKMDLGIRADS